MIIEAIKMPSEKLEIYGRCVGYSKISLALGIY
jgi:hypothetical protein